MKTLFIALALLAAPILMNAQQPVTDTTKRVADTVKAVPAHTVQPVASATTTTTTQPKQRKDTRPLKDRIDFNINTGFWANSGQATGELMVLVSYRFPKILSIGAGPTYVYSYQYNVSKSLSGYGGKIFARAQLLKFIYLWTEYQGLSNQYVSGYNPVTTDRAYSDSWFWGAGLNFFGINVSVMYDILHDSKSLYAGATICRLGYSF